MENFNFLYTPPSGTSLLLMDKIFDEHFLINELVKAGFDAEKLFTSALQARKCEQLSWRYALLKLLEKNKIPFCDLAKDENGAPFLVSKSGFISVSHTNTQVAVAFNPNVALGIDSQPINSKIENLQHKFLNEYEIELSQNNIDTLTKAWTIKEAVYKLVNQKGLALKDIEIQRFIDHNFTSILVNNIKINTYSIIENNTFLSVAFFSED